MRNVRFSRLLLLALSTLVACVLWPGTHGSFLFDDFVNLPALGQYGPVDNLRALFYYLTVGLGDPAGRPLSMLSFLLDAHDWPASPAPFLRTNIFLHILNGLLLFVTLCRLDAARGRHDPPSPWAPLLACSFWMLHPLFLSTTLYIVQRESMLCATFVLLGFLAWLRGRSHMERGATRSGLAWLLVAGVGCTMLATLCKANGILLPALLLVAEATVLPPPTGPARRKMRLARAVFLALPAILVLAGLLISIPWATATTASTRPWTLTQRLLTEPRVLLDYLHQLLLPRPLGSGVFQDAFPVSQGPWQPWSTLPALVLLATIGLLAWKWRRRFPIAAFAALFFLVGHSLEGSTIPLELHFEHRNYLPAMPLFWPLAAWLTATGPLRKARAIAALAIVALLAAETRAGASIWGQPERLALEWAARSPTSARAQAWAAQYEMQAGRPDAAATRLRKALAQNSEDPQLAFNLVDAECMLGGATPATVAAMQHGLTQARNSARLAFDWINHAIATASAQACHGIDLALIASLLETLRANPTFADAPGRQQDLDHIDGLLSLARGDAETAAALFDRGLKRYPRATVALQQAALLASASRPDLGLRHLDLYVTLPPLATRSWPTMGRLHAWLLHHWNYWGAEVDRLRRQLADEARPAGPVAGEGSISHTRESSTISPSGE